MTERHGWLGSLVPLLLVTGTGTGTQCRLSTESGTGELRISGTVHFVETSGGCWRLDAGGRHYELLPEQAPADLLRDGVTATITAHPIQEAETGCRVGLPLAVRRVVTLEEPRP